MLLIDFYEELADILGYCVDRKISLIEFSSDLEKLYMKAQLAGLPITKLTDEQLAKILSERK